MDKKTKLGYMTLEETRADYLPTHNLYILIDKKLKVGEFSNNDWDYGYSLEKQEGEEGIRIQEIKEVKKVPKELSDLKIAIEEVDFPTKLNQYRIIIGSSLKNKEIEDEIYSWLKEEKGEKTKIITHIIHISKVTRKKIPFTMENLAKLIKRGAKVKFKEANADSSQP